MADAKSISKKIKDEEIKFVDLRFTDPRGKMQHLTMDAEVMDEDAAETPFVDDVRPRPDGRIEALEDGLELDRAVASREGELQDLARLERHVAVSSASHRNRHGLPRQVEGPDAREQPALPGPAVAGRSRTRWLA